MYDGAVAMQICGRWMQNACWVAASGFLRGSVFHSFHLIWFCEQNFVFFFLSSQTWQRTQIKEVFFFFNNVLLQSKTVDRSDEWGRRRKQMWMCFWGLPSLPLPLSLLIHCRQNTNLWSRLPLIHRSHNWNLTLMLRQTVSSVSEMSSILALASTGWVTVWPDFEWNTSFRGTLVELVRQFAPLWNILNLM